MGTLQLNMKRVNNLEISIYDVLGKKVQQIENNKYLKGIHNISFDTTNLESGTYFIKYQSNEMVNNVKFVVSH
jgi:alkaline phosphatase D